MLSHKPICIKYQDENNSILGVDTSELRFGGVQNSSLSWKLVLELSSLNHTNPQCPNNRLAPPLGNHGSAPDGNEQVYWNVWS